MSNEHCKNLESAWLEALLKVLSIPKVKSATASTTPVKSEMLVEFIVELMPILRKKSPDDFISYWENEAVQDDDWRLKSVKYAASKMSVPESSVLADFLIVKHARTRLPSHWPRVCRELAPIYSYNGIATPAQCVC